MTLPSLPWRVQMYDSRAVIVSADLVSFEVILAQHGGEVPDVRDSQALAQFIVGMVNCGHARKVLDVGLQGVAGNRSTMGGETSTVDA